MLSERYYCSAGAVLSAKLAETCQQVLHCLINSVYTTCGIGALQCRPDSVPRHVVVKL